MYKIHVQTSYWCTGLITVVYLERLSDYIWLWVKIICWFDFKRYVVFSPQRLLGYSCNMASWQTVSRWKLTDLISKPLLFVYTLYIYRVLMTFKSLNCCHILWGVIFRWTLVTWSKHAHFPWWQLSYIYHFMFTFKLFISLCERFSRSVYGHS